ncbi:MAG: hypothetical protein ABIQ12_13370 [Opitutaceae bacterium]
MNFLREVSPRAGGLQLAGTVSTAAWMLLAWRSHQGGAPLALTLVVIAVAWLAMAWALLAAMERMAGWVAFWAVIFRLVAMGAQPVMEDDHYRFLWDGYQFSLTGNPYATAPQASFTDATVPVGFREILDRINHPDVPTIYGPGCQWAFRLCHAIAPSRLWPWKLLLLASELALAALLWRGLSARGRLVLAWCPLAIFETGFNAHPDVLAITVLVAGWWAARRRWIVVAGAAVGIAVATKIFAVLLGPFVLWRLGWRAWGAAGMAVVVCYAPFWAQGSAADLAGLRAMAAEWEFNSSVYAVVSAVSLPSFARAACGLAFAAIWAGLLAQWNRKMSQRRHAPGRALPPGEWVFGWFLLLSAVANPWYALWLWPFVAARISWPGLAALAAVSLAYVTGLNLGDQTLGNFGHPWWLRPVEFGAVALVALWCLGQKKTRSRIPLEGS